MEVGMARQRSPRYPSYAVGDAIDYARKIYNGDGMHPMDREVAVRHLGYTSLNGASATALGGLKQYGLTIDAGKGMVKLTDLALDIIEPVDNESRDKAIQIAAFSPALFHSLRERFPDRAPSPENLRGHLIREGFTKSAVPSVIEAYLATCEYVEKTEELESHGIAESSSVNPEKSSESTGGQQMIEGGIHTETPQPSPPPEVVEAQLNKISAEIVGDRVRVSGYLDAKGLGLLKKKISALEAFLAIDADQDDDE
ncbi:hypothetical protein [Pseudoruegeria sp. SHC-113]|uniref:hypothetical protein n=1 Tax=Pseudoruegeria sp. SHC-113 TaxID=2855439 RepID=UPI0021BB9DA0|nr:hypothetical protein [Pseudoruegeria sp. SHC-113]MCT8161258.1 hypothetical protein [Pseudoruegeria sp. SHC-113]